MFSETIAEWQKALTLGGDSQLAATLQQAYAASGWTGYLQKRLESLEATAPTGPVSPPDFVYADALLGDQDHAREWPEKAHQERDPWLNVKAEPRLDNLRWDPRFKDIVRRLGLPP